MSKVVICIKQDKSYLISPKLGEKYLAKNKIKIYKIDSSSEDIHYYRDEAFNIESLSGISFGFWSTNLFEYLEEWREKQINGILN